MAFSTEAEHSGKVSRNSGFYCTDKYIPPENSEGTLLRIKDDFRNLIANSDIPCTCIRENVVAMERLQKKEVLDEECVELMCKALERCTDLPKSLRLRAQTLKISFDKMYK